MILLLTLAFGLVGLDRWVLPTLFAASMGADLHLNAGDLGNLVGILGVAWGLSAFFIGGLSDRFGRRRVLVPAIVAFSCLSILSGAAGGLVSLLLIRAIMGISEGPVASIGVAVAVEASHPKRRGTNNGLFQCAFALFGLALAPIIATQLLRVTSWRVVFLLVGIPGLIMAILIGLTVREPPNLKHDAHSKPKRAPMSAMFKHRNVGLAMAGLLCAMMGIFVLSAMMPSYLTGYLKLNNTQMGFVASAIGFGGFLGQFLIPAISDVLGRRLVAVLSFVLSAVFLWLFIRTGVHMGTLFALLFVASWANFGALALIAGPLAAEAAPLGLISSVAGIVIGCGEIFGGGIAPSIAGGIATHYGIQYTLWFAMAGQLVGIIVSLFFKETAPRFTRAGGGSALDTSPESLAGAASNK
ncbi:MAG TPA: MFS transporter [Steroidobacteraceae bacterium]|jgi:MFS family permease|nr:MFS transporter [Steroidobacteraceae bacterium]